MAHRTGAHGWWLAILIAIAVSLCAAQQAAASKTYFAHYYGSASERATSNFTSPPPGSSVTGVWTLTWDVKKYYDSQGQITQQSFVARGTQETISGGDDIKCTIEQASPTAAYIAISPFGDTIMGSMPEYFFGNIKYSGGPAGHCQNNTSAGGIPLFPWNADGSGSFGCLHFPAAQPFVADWAFSNVLPNHTEKWKLSQTGIDQPCPNETDSGTRSINATLQIGTGGPPPTKQPLPDQDRKRWKKLAQDDMKSTLAKMPMPCILVAAGTTAAVWSATVPAAAYASRFVASRLLNTALPLCTRMFIHAYVDARIVLDPPDRHYWRLAQPAKLPHAATAGKCASQPRSFRAFCAHFDTLLSRYLASVGRAESVASALKTTTNRAAAAAKARNRTALKRQDRHGNQLAAELKAAVRAESRAGAALAKLISSEHVAGHLTQAEDATALGFIRTKLLHKGLTDAQLQSLAGPSFNPKPVNALAALR